MGAAEASFEAGAGIGADGRAGAGLFDLGHHDPRLAEFMRDGNVSSTGVSSTPMWR
jgi:hypothetical protein